MPTYELRVNGSARRIETHDPDQPLLYVLRGLGLTAAKYGCGLGQCGSCNVLVDGKALPSCQLPVASVAGKAIITLEGLGSAAHPHPVQAAFVRESVPQCGYCTPGLIVSAAALLAENPKPNEAEIRTALDGNLCRCGTHARVVRAVLLASGQGG